MAALSENASPLNQAALKWLRQAQEYADPHSLHVLTLAAWGLDAEAEGEWPARERPALESQVHSLLGWKAENAEAWLLSNPNGPARVEQERSLAQALRQASKPPQAAALVLNQIYSRQQSENPSLQPAASALS